MAALEAAAKKAEVKRKKQEKITAWNQETTAARKEEWKKEKQEEAAKQEIRMGGKELTFEDDCVMIENIRVESKSTMVRA